MCVRKGGKMRAVRGSEVSDFLRCRYKWSESWINGLKPKKPQTALLFGTLFHKYMEGYYSGGTPEDGFNAMQKLLFETDTSSMDEVEINDMWNLLLDVTKNYVDHWKSEDSELKVIGTEVHFRIPLDEQIAFEGTIDLIYEDQDGNLWFADHKTTSSIEKYEKSAIMDRQISRYWWALQQLCAGNGEIETKLHDSGKVDIGWMPVSSGLFKELHGKQVHGFIYNIIKKEIPEPPKVLKGGGLSKDKSQKTTYYLYMQALMQYVPTEKWFEYTEILDMLQEHKDRYFKRVPVYRLQQEVDASIREFWATSLDLNQVANMDDVSRTYATYRNIAQDCVWCAYQSICAAGIEGSDVEMIRNTLYTTEEK